MKVKRETEVSHLKKAIDDEAKTHEVQLHELRSRHNAVSEELNEQLDQVKRVSLLHRMYGISRYP